MQMGCKDLAWVEKPIPGTTFNVALKCLSSRVALNEEVIGSLTTLKDEGSRMEDCDLRVNPVVNASKNKNCFEVRLKCMGMAQMGTD